MLSQAEVIKRILVIEPDLDIEVFINNKKALMMILNGAEVERNDISKKLVKICKYMIKEKVEKMSNQEIRKIIESHEKTSISL